MGSNARTGSARYSDRYVTFAGMIREAHRQAGDDVFIRNWEPDIQHEGWGRIYLGLSSPAYIGSDRIYGTLIALSELRDGPHHDPRLRFFVDDPNLRALRNAISSVARDPSKILSPFNMRRRDYKLVADDPEMHKKLARGMRLLDGLMAWPTTYLPVFPWGDAAVLSSALRPEQRACVRAVDPSGLVPLADLQQAAEDAPVSSTLIPHDPFWVAESSLRDPWVRSTNVRGPLMGARTGTDATRISLYRSALGVLEPQLSADGPGWWSSRMLLAAAAKTYYATQWRGLKEMAHNLPYVLALPGAYEDMNDLERAGLVAAQDTALSQSVWSAAQALEALDVRI